MSARRTPDTRRSRATGYLAVLPGSTEVGVEVESGDGSGSADPVALDTSSRMLGLGSGSDCISIAEEEHPPRRNNTKSNGVVEASAVT